MNHRLFRLRRVGVAAIAGVTALGAAAVVGEGVAAAAPTTVTSALATGAAPTTILGTQADTAGAAIDVTLTGGSLSTSDQIVLTLPCTGTTTFTTASTASQVGSAAVWTPTPSAATGCTLGDNVLSISPAAAVTTNSSTVVQITPHYKTSGAAPGAINLTGTYLALGSSITFSVVSDATVNWFSVTSNTPPASLANNGTAQAVSNVMISQPANFTGTSLSGTSVTVSLNGGAKFGATPVVSQTGTTTAPVMASVSVPATSITFTAGTFASTTPSLVTLSNLQIIPSGPGAVTANITYSGTALSTSVLANVLGNTNQFYGSDGTAAGTVAQEFEAAFPVTGSSGGNATAVLATSADPYDALSASYLEGQLGTGLLITPPTKLGTDALQAMRLEGVKTVYVIGGPDAISSAVLTQLKATPAYNPGGVTTTGADLQVIGPIYGATAEDTAQKISTYFGSSAYGALGVSGAYSAASTSSGGGLYNNTTGNASTSGPATASSTAIVISATDWQDAMTVAPMAYAARIPVVLTSATSLSTQASATLTTLGAKQVIVIGGQLALSNAVVTSIQGLNGGVSVLRIAGQTPSDTAGQLANFELAAAPNGLGWGQSTSPAGMATSAFLVSHANYWSDALGAAAIGGRDFAVTSNGTTTHYGYEPILLVKSPTDTGKYIGPVLNAAGSAAGIQGDMSIRTLNVLGGPLAMPASIVSTLQADLAAG